MKKLLLSLLLLLGCLLPLRAKEYVAATLTPKSGTTNNFPNVSVYTKEILSTNNQWGLFAFNNKNNDWDDIRCGRKSDPSVARIFTNVALEPIITKIVVNVTKNTQSDKINKIYLKIGESKDNYTSAEIEPESIPTSGAMTFYIPTVNQHENQFYCIYFDCEETGENGCFGINEVDFYSDKSGTSGPSKWHSIFSEKYSIIQGRSIDLNAIVEEANPPVLSYEITSGNEAGTLENGIFTANENADNITATIKYTWDEDENWLAGEGTLEITVIHQIEYLVDTLNVENFGFTGSYSENLYTSTETDITYSGKAMLHYGGMQINDNDKQAGFVVTANPNNYYLARVDVIWNSHTITNKKLHVYGKSSAYSNVADLYINGGALRGTEIAEIVDPDDTDEIWTSIADAYDYIGIYSGGDGPEYINAITLYWVKREAAVGPAPIEVPDVVITGTSADAEETNLLTAGTTIGIAVPENMYTSYRVYFNGNSGNWLEMPEGSILIRPGEYGSILGIPGTSHPETSTITFKSGELYTPTVVAYRTADNILEEKETVCDPFLTQPAMSVTPSMAENTALVPRSVQFYVTNPAAKIYYSTTKSMDNAEEYTGPVELAAGADILFWCELEADTDTRATTTYTSPAVFFQNNEAAPVSVEGIAADENAEVRYFDLQGRAVKADRLNPGIYIRIRGSKASKILVR